MYQSFRKKYCYVEDKQLFWELLKMEIRSTTISFAKRKANWSKSREFAIKQQLNNLDDIICNSDDLQNVSPQLDQNEERDLEAKVFGSSTVSVQQNISLIQKNEII